MVQNLFIFNDRTEKRKAVLHEISNDVTIKSSSCL